MPANDSKYELSNEGIDKYFRSFGADYGGTVPKDRLPVVSNKFIIVNFDNHTGGGTHWALLYNCDPEQVVYFDSYGEPPPTSVQRWMDKTKKPQLINQQEIQALGSPWCGQYCIACAHCLHEGVSFKNFLSLFSLKPSQNDKNIARWAKQLHNQLEAS